MESFSKIQPPLQLSLPNRSFPKPPFSSVFFPKTPSSKPPSTKTPFKTHKSFLLKSSSSSSHHPQTPSSLPKKPSFLPKQSSALLPSTKNPLPSLLKSISISLVTAAALFFTRFNHNRCIAALPTTAPPSTARSSDATPESEKERERSLEEFLDSHPDDVSSLRALMEIKIKLQKLPEAIDIIDRLIALQPIESEWPLLRAHLHLYGGEVETAKSAFEEIISTDPFRVEAYHGLAMAAMQSEPQDLEALMKRIEGVIERCKKEKKGELREFKLLVAQVRVIEGKYEEALKVYQQLVKEEPRDFRPYLCQGIIYTLLRKMDEAEKQFEKYRRLVPKGHPYADYFDDNVLATKVFSQMAEKDRAGLKR
ncbi:protein SLOW GREEN 1, chloroplastic-like [Magnolia sinica]|uniref:protein SLOW GREEN 1, chloroplastic-like n=1 Tax=Magnolia sinica TaxID=86752 RepID=UPI00265A82B7|nr:protein SLOW GREEN 1, chloroplastic-like [Magnolia sinica]XP_058109834.1 protein SLOW GREEN 1, chloroplastic-like [Magnolia sinica]